MKQTILFDLDGTLIDPRASITRSAQHALRAVGIPADDPDALSFFIGPPLHETFRDSYHLDAARVQTAVEAFDEYYLQHITTETHVYDGIVPMLQNLCTQGRTLFIATSKPSIYADYILRDLDLRAYFSGIFGSGIDGTNGKKEEILSLALASMDSPAVETLLMVGDREQDVQGAKANGLDCVGVLYGFGSAQELQSAGAAFIVSTVAELSSLLLQEPMR